MNLCHCLLFVWHWLGLMSSPTLLTHGPLTSALNLDWQNGIFRARDRDRDVEKVNSSLEMCPHSQRVLHTPVAPASLDRKAECRVLKR